MDELLRPKFGNGPGTGKRSPIDIRIGAMQAALPCLNCQKMQQAGFYVIQGNGAVMICMKCAAGAIVKYQEINPLEKLFEVDIDLAPDAMNKALEAARREAPDVSEATVEKIVRTAVDQLGI